MRNILLYLSFLCALPAFSQSHMRVEKNDGSVVRYAVDELSQVRFEVFCQLKDSVSVCGQVGSYNYVDLGLPSGLKWATCNIGAKSATDFGEYFAWGETKTKTTFSWENYKLCQASEDKLTKYCLNSSYGKYDGKEVLEESDDAAHVNWGETWRMPSAADFKELLEGCVWKTTNNFNNTGVAGVMGISKKNYNIIFFPAAGFYVDDKFYDEGAFYWSSNLTKGTMGLANYSSLGQILDFPRNEVLTLGRRNGTTIRPVTK